MKANHYRSINDLPELCSMADLEEVLPISRATAYRMAQQGVIPCLRVGRRFIFSKEHLRKWIEQEMSRKAVQNEQTS